MIQRVQTPWLLIAAACAVASFKFSYYTGTNAKGLSPYELKADESILLMMATVAVSVLALFTVFLFKKRPLQLRMCVLGIFLEAFLIFLYYREVKTFTQGTYSLTSLLHSIIVIAFFLAARGIHSDEKIIKDSNRLR